MYRKFEEWFFQNETEFKSIKKEKKNEISIIENLAKNIFLNEAF